MIRYVNASTICKECGRRINEYNSDWPCRKNHDWRGTWREDKTSKKFKRYSEKYKKALKKAQYKKYDKLNKLRPDEYVNNGKLRRII